MHVLYFKIQVCYSWKKTLHRKYDKSVVTLTVNSTLYSASGTFFDINSLPQINETSHVNETIPINVCSDNTIDFPMKHVSICKSVACKDSDKQCDTCMNHNYCCGSIGKIESSV